tara:strand:- start:122 stop:496 length:375 start_codon:yes stop_codon:yes gene_type:complete
MQLSKTQQKYIDAIIEHSDAVGVNTNKTNFSRAELRLISMALKGKKWIPNWITHDQSRRVDRGVFSIPEVMDTINPQVVSPGQETEGDGLDDSVVEVTEVTPHTYVEDDPQTDVNQQAMEELTL